MARIYLSPSTQEANQYAGGPTGYADSEEYWCRKVCAEAEGLLRKAGHTVRVGGSASAGANADDSNAWKADWHVAVHTNAGGGRGTECWHYTGSTKGKALATATYKRIAPVSDEADRGVKSSTAYIELRKTRAPSVIIEMVFHDRASEAQEIRTGWQEFARAVADGICDVAGGSVPTVEERDFNWFVSVIRSKAHKAEFLAFLDRIDIGCGIGTPIVLAGDDDKAIVEYHIGTDKTRSAVAWLEQHGYTVGKAQTDTVVLESRSPADNTARDSYGKLIRRG